MANAIGIYFHGGTFGAADGSGPSVFVNYSGSDGSAVQFPSQTDFAGGGSNGFLCAEDNSNSLVNGFLVKRGATAGELVPLLEETTTGTTTGFTAGSGTSANDDSTFTGGSGTAAYTIGDIVLALKNVNILAAS